MSAEDFKCPDCGLEVQANGYRDGCLAIKCSRDARRFDIEVNVQRQFLTLPMIDRISKNEMPFCFNTQRETLVAMAILLMTAMRQNEELATALQMQGSQTQH